MRIGALSVICAWYFAVAAGSVAGSSRSAMVVQRPNNRIEFMLNSSKTHGEALAATLPLRFARRHCARAWVTLYAHQPFRREN